MVTANHETELRHRALQIGAPDLILLKLSKLTAEIAHTHHEKFDGSGYPRGLKGVDIPLFGRIVAVRRRVRCTHIGLPVQESMEQRAGSQLLREGAGTHFEPVCVDAFFADFEEVLKIKGRFVDEEMELRDRAPG